MARRRTEKEIITSSQLAFFVKKKRKNIGLTQECLSLRVGVGIAFIKRLETGSINLQYAKILQVLDYLGAEVSFKEKDR